MYFDAILIDFVGDVLALLACFTGSGVPTFREGVPKRAFADVPWPAMRDDIPDCARVGVSFGGLPFRGCLGDPDVPGVAALRRGVVPSVDFAGVCFPGLASFDIDSFLFVLGVPFEGVPPPF